MSDQGAHPKDFSQMKCVSLIILVSILFSCTNQKKIIKSEKTDEVMTKTASGLTYIILKKGIGPPAKEGQEVLIYETTSYLNGTILYSNENTGNPVKVLIGGHQATDGVDEGLRGMQIGEIRKLILPPFLSKRTTYPDNISPDSTIVVKIELYKIL